MSAFLTSWDKFRFSFIPKKFYLGYQSRRASNKFEPELKLLKYLIPPGSIAIDGGANKGVYSWFLSKTCLEVHAFEPNPAMFAYLQKSVPKNTFCYRVALSDTHGQATFHLPTSSGIFHNTRGSLLKVFGESGCREFNVETRRIDDFDFENVGFIKLDIEGAELLALKGAENTIERDRPLILAETMEVGDSSNEELSNFLKEKGYLPMVYSDGFLSFLGRDKFGHNCFYFPQ